MPWLDTLTIPEPSNVPAGIYVFQGEAVGSFRTVVNPFVQISSEGQVDVVWSTNQGRLWSYDESSDEITDGTSAGNGLIASILSQLARYGFSDGTHVVMTNLAKTDVIGKLVPGS